MGEKFTFIHTGDWHLGNKGASSKTGEFESVPIHKETEERINQRQDDIDKAAKQVIEIAIEKKVDAVLNAGDSWDNWKHDPYVENIHTALVEELRHYDIDYVEIVGNHDLPRQKGKGCHLETLGRFPNAYTVYQGMYEQIVLPKHDDVVIHAVPSPFFQEMLNEELAKVKPVKNKVNIGMGHFGVTLIKHYAMNAINSFVVDLEVLKDLEMDYFCLADYHKTMNFGHNIWYSGSIERMGFGEITNTPKVLYVEIDKETKEVTVEEIPLKTRPMISLLYHAKGKEIGVVNDEVSYMLENENLEGKIVRLRIKELAKEDKHLFDHKKVSTLTKPCLYYKTEFKDIIENIKGNKEQTDIQFDVVGGWGSFATSIEDDGTFDKNELVKEGQLGLEEAMDEIV